ncbi:glycoside hydrolase family 2 protein [Nonomuraea jiangxiensis]|uniref:beta-mannosidase n=1 Tax=Nonomuraea jiangxiensis TaxID=633440 RepID=A0A1G8T0J3_9ACTN|nr:glycoside hydrolase family 2 protein [Nonomuraea jiangxiensis]SDJ35028.1 beta-mannosidase [Nonomuraea jiangxiensis]
MYRPLHDGWTLRAAGDAPVGPAAIPARVPGSVHTDLLAAGLIDDPYRDDNETRLGWIGRTDWVYETTFDWQDDGHERADLVCAGLDTIAVVSVNGQEAGRTANMHRTYRFEVRDLLRAGANTLRVAFRAPYAYAEEQRELHGERPGPYDEPYPFIRKMACNFGWDWGPTLVTSGIWREIGLHSWSGTRLAEVRPLVRGDGVDVHIRVERTGDAPVTVTADVAGVRAETKLEQGESTAVVRLDVPDAERWWPRGHGGQPLYALTVRAGADRWQREIGFRTIELDPDAFRLIVNGRPVFVRGYNWIPDHCFPAMITPERLAERFGQATAGGANALRVWGGGLYESEDFYTLADRLGLLIWQDFPFACSAYPEEEPFRTEVEAEARDNVARLSCHPSLALWCGNNENIEGHQHWDWRAPLGGRSWGATFYYDLLPGIVAELDPTRPYWPGTPYSGAPDRDVRDPSTGTVHLWDVWNHEDYTRYAGHTPRFVAEFGFQGPPAYATLRAASSDEPPTPDSSHQKAADGQAKLLRGLGAHLPRPGTFDDWHYYTQLNQARAMAFGVERFRSLMPYCMGTIVWQLNDCWPVTSWAAVDGAGRRKPLWYALRRAFADRLITRQDGDVVLVNDTDEEWAGTLALALRDLSGRILAAGDEPVTVAPRATLRVGPPRQDQGPQAALLTAELGSLRALFTLAEDPALAYPLAAYTAAVEPEEGGLAVTVTATTILRELALFPDRLDPAASVDEQLVTLLPGESRTFHVTTERDLDPAALTAYPVLRCVNEPH